MLSIDVVDTDRIVQEHVQSTVTVSSQELQCNCISNSRHCKGYCTTLLNWSIVQITPQVNLFHDSGCEIREHLFRLIRNEY